MIIYFIIFFFGILFYNENKNEYKFEFILTLFLLGIFRGTTVGTDYFNYIALFEQRNYSIWDYDFKQILLIDNSEEILTKQMEPLWYVLNYFFDYLGANYSLVNLFSLVIVLSVYIFVFQKKSVNPGLSILLLYALFYYFMSFNTVRQSIALAFILLFYYNYYNKKWYYALFTFLIAVGFHYSAFFALIILLIPFININKKFSFFLLIFSLVFGSLLSGLIIKIFSFNTIYNSYSELKWGDSNVIVSTIYNLLHCLLFYFTTRKSNTKYLNENFTKIWFWGLIIQNIFVQYILFSRLSDYLIAAQLIAIPFYLPPKLSFNFNKLNKFFLMILFLIFLIFSFNLIFNRQGVVPFEIMGF